MCFYTPALDVREPYYRVLLMQGKDGGVNWLIGWRRPVLKKIKKLEISKQERHHEVLLTLKNLGDLSLNLAPYIIPVIPRPLRTKIIEGE